MKTQVKHDDWLLEKLQDAEFAAQFLNAAGVGDGTKTYLTALRKVVDARGGIASVAAFALLPKANPLFFTTKVGRIGA